mmetsp:Transcript_60136/g.172702  ORF Transcript_60136/g.172702 Transcript_60136/m.172702 type:complete len:351 (+) Transcript_60136:949-2001(+)
MPARHAICDLDRSVFGLSSGQDAPVIEADGGLHRQLRAQLLWQTLHVIERRHTLLVQQAVDLRAEGEGPSELLHVLADLIGAELVQVQPRQASRKAGGRASQLRPLRSCRGAFGPHPESDRLLEGRGRGAHLRPLELPLLSGNRGRRPPHVVSLGAPRRAPGGRDAVVEARHHRHGLDHPLLRRRHEGHLDRRIDPPRRLRRRRIVGVDAHWRLLLLRLGQPGARRPFGAVGVQTFRRFLSADLHAILVTAVILHRLLIEGRPHRGLLARPDVLLSGAFLNPVLLLLVPIVRDDRSVLFVLRLASPGLVAVVDVVAELDRVYVSPLGEVGELFVAAAATVASFGSECRGP